MMAGLARQGMARHGQARFGRVGQARRGAARRGMVWPGSAGQAGPGLAGHGLAGPDTARQVRRGWPWLGLRRQRGAHYGAFPSAVAELGSTNTTHIQEK